MDTSLGYIVEVTGKLASQHNQATRPCVIPMEFDMCDSRAEAMKLAIDAVNGLDGLVIEKVEIVCSFLV